jgi:hypothetical protein
LWKILKLNSLACLVDGSDHSGKSKDAKGKGGNRNSRFLIARDGCRGNRQQIFTTIAVNISECSTKRMYYLINAAYYERDLNL